MLNKLAFRNAKRSLNDYLLYFITMVLVTALLYSHAHISYYLYSIYYGLACTLHGSVYG